MTDSTIWIDVAVAVLSVALIGALGFFLIQRMRARRRSLKKELSESPAFADDRAHNQIRLARAELEILKRDGVEPPRVRELLDQADAELAKHENVEAVRLARNAQDLLVGARRDPGSSRAPAILPAEAPPRRSRGASPHDPTDLLTASADIQPEEPREAGAPSRPPKNRMEAHFQMTLLVEDLTATRRDGGGSAAANEAEKMRSDAQTAYAAADYTEALRLALKGRRRLGGRLETLPPARPSTEGATASIPGSKGAGSGPPILGSPCPRCGQPTRPADQFCRSCGAPRTPLTCPRCQATVVAEDTFCGRCGAPIG